MSADTGGLQCTQPHLPFRVPTNSSEDLVKAAQDLRALISDNETVFLRLSAEL